MRGLPWHVAIRADRRAVLTALGASLGVAFALVSFAVPAGLQSESVSPDGPYAHQDALVALPGFEPFEASRVDAPGATSALVVEAMVEHRHHVVLVAFEGPRAPHAVPGAALGGPGFAGLSSVRLSSPEVRILPLVGSAGAPLVAPTMLVLHPRDLRAIEPALADKVSYVLVPGMSEARASELERQGFDVLAVPSMEPFFRESGREVATGLGLVVVFSSTLVAVFTYEFMRSEVRERRREIGLWRAVGMRSTDVVALLLARSAAIGAAGILAGTTLGYVALSAARSVSGSDIFALALPASTIALLVLAFLVASLLGGLVPALAAARSTVRSQLEAAP